MCRIWDGSYDTTGMMSYGHMVEVRHADGNTTLYAHLSEINVQQGEKVVRGQRIGRVGSTGNATGPHLHFEVITSEGKADPAEYLWTMPGEWIMAMPPIQRREYRLLLLAIQVNRLYIFIRSPKKRRQQ